MARQFGTIEVKKQRGKMVVQGNQSTPRGTKFLAGHEQIHAHSTSDPKFKGELKKAVEKLIAGPSS